MKKAGTMKRYLKSAHKKYPLVKAAFLGIFILLEIAGLILYKNNAELLHNITPSVIKDSYLPSFGYSLHKGTAEVEDSTPASTVPVLVYHGVVSKDDGSNVMIRNFREQMFALKRAGYTAVSLSDFEAYMSGQKQLKEKSFLLTFDDGRKDSYYPVDPILKALDYHATMFVISEHVTSNNHSTYYLDADELRRMVHSGRWDIEAHADKGHDLVNISKTGEKGHFYSDKIWLAAKNRLETEAEYEQRVQADLLHAKTDLEKELGLHITAFAYPFGDYGQETHNNPQAERFITGQVASIYKYAFSQEQNTKAAFGHTTAGQNPYFLQRIEVYDGWSAPNLLAVIKIGDAKKLPYRDDFSGITGWQQSYGQTEIDGFSGLRLRPGKDGTSAGAMLGGTAGWHNYTFEVQATKVQGELTVISRYRDAKNYKGCSYNAGVVSAFELKNGERYVLDSEDSAGAIPTLYFAVQASASSLRCLVGGQVVAAADIDDGTGGIGLAIWAQTPNTAMAQIKYVNVTGL